MCAGPVIGLPGHGSATGGGQPAPQPSSGCHPKRQLYGHCSHHSAPRQPFSGISMRTCLAVPGRSVLNGQ
jgi:hypothetical protein